MLNLIGRRATSTFDLDWRLHFVNPTSLIWEFLLLVSSFTNNVVISRRMDMFVRFSTLCFPVSVSVHRAPAEMGSILKNVREEQILSFSKKTQTDKGDKIIS